MVDQLNEDNWAIVIKYLSLSDQISLMQSCEYLEHIVQNNWRCTVVAKVDDDVLKLFNREPQTMHCFLERASKSLEKLILRGADLELLLPSWKPYDFQRLRSLDCHVWCVHSYDQSMLLLAQLFPNVTKLNIKATSRGDGIWHFQQLEELTLNASSLNPTVLDCIFERLPLRRLALFPFFSSLLDDLALVHKCRTLEEFLIHDFNLKFDMLRSLLELPNFYRLSFYTLEYYETYMRNLRALQQEHRVRSLVFNSCFWFFTNVSSYIVRFKNLRRLVVQDDDIDKSQLLSICSQLKHLESLHLLQISEFLSASDVWDMVEACGSLMVFNISYNDLDANFLEDSQKLMDRALLNRSSPLALHVYDTSLALDTQEVLKCE
ncbi:hypothetical protein KR044_005161 [Drosophila immigrans]|nr:hypothetical protein KR044_005161 [Drosophila immigrans]